MLWFWLLLTFLGPLIGCLVFVMFTPQPNVLVAALGAIVGMVASLGIAVLFN